MPVNKTIYQLIKTQASQRPNAVAIAAPDEKVLNYKQLFQLVNKTGKQLNALGIGRNDPVAVVLPNGPEMAAAFLSIAAFATCAPLNPAYQAREFEFFLSDLGAKALVTYKDPYPRALEAAANLQIPVVQLEKTGDGKAGTFTLAGYSQSQNKRSGPADPADTALMLHTSGTTSKPKLVPLTQTNLAASAENISRTLMLKPADRCLNIMPLFHIHGLMAALLASIHAGASVVCTTGYDATLFFNWLKLHRPSWYTAVPTMHQAILGRAAADPTVLEGVYLRFIRSSSASLPPRIMRDLERTFRAPLVEAYGMTEASHQITSNPLPPGERKWGSVGQATGPDVAIMAEDSHDLAANGETGEIVLRGPTITAGYAHNPEADAKAFADGWFRTGDQGYFDQDGYLFITGRLKEIINRGGEKISPREIDEVLLNHPAIFQAVTFAVPDEVLGEDIAVAIIPKEGQSISQQEVRRYVSRHLAPFKIPARVVFVETIPKGATGKLQRIGLAKQLGISDLKPVEPVERSPQDESPSITEELLIKIWTEVLETENFGVHDRFLDVGGDSILATKLAMTIRKKLNVDLPVVEFYAAPTIKEQAELIDSMLPQEI